MERGRNHKARAPNEYDKKVAKILRDAREERGMSLVGLAEKVGVKYQQIQKYESGHNRVSFGRIMELGVALGKRVSAWALLLEEQSEPFQASLKDYESKEKKAEEAISFLLKDSELSKKNKKSNGAE